MRASETAEMIFDNCRIPDSQRMGEIGDGFKQALKVLDGGRISIACLALGIAKGAYEASYNIQRNVTSLTNLFQASREFLLSWQIWQPRLKHAELLILQACDLINRKENVTKAAAMAKYYAA